MHDFLRFEIVAATAHGERIIQGALFVFQQSERRGFVPAGVDMNHAQFAVNKSFCFGFGADAGVQVRHLAAGVLQDHSDFFIYASWTDACQRLDGGRLPEQQLG